MSSYSRKLLRRIALGLPLVGAPLGGVLLLTSACTCSNGNCGQPFAMTTHPIDATQHAQLFDAMGLFIGGMSTGCRDVCLQLDVSGPTDGGIDAGGGDAGLGAALYSSVTCSVASPGGVETVSCTYSNRCIGGRAPSGLARAEVAGGGVGGWLARAAHLERASVPAFEELAIELALHGAPERMVGAAARAADEERRHAELVEALALRRGATIPTVQRSPVGARSLRALAEDNAVEGCVREAYGALVAAHQARHAMDAEVRVAYQEIAADEARHALLSLAIHEWASARLARPAALAVEARRLHEIEAWRDAMVEPEPSTRRALGLPSATASAALLAALA